MSVAIPQDVMMHDVWQWVGRGWFWHKAGGQQVPAELEQVSEEVYRVICTNGDEHPFRRKECFVHWPQCGAVNMQGYAIVLNRTQQRQYRRTYNSRCLTLDIPRKWDAMKRYESVKKITADSPEVVVAAFEPTYYTYSTALGLLEQGWVSVALNPFLIVAGTPEEQLIYYRSKLTARIEGGKLVPLDPTNSRNRRIMKWFDGRVASEQGS